VSSRVDPDARLFAGVASLYERGRPSYPDDAVRWIGREFGLGRHSTVLDLAAGTGKLTRVLARHAGTVVAVEPLAEMRALLPKTCPAAAVLEGDAEAIPLADGSVDAVTVGEAFHWFATACAIVEIARVLRPGGGLALLWNLSPLDREWAPWEREVEQVLTRTLGPDPTDRHAYYTGAWREPFADGRLFGDLCEAAFDNMQTRTVDEYLAELASWTRIAALPGAGKATVRAIGDVLARHGVTRVERPFETRVYCARRR
jgi:ubiquinone/menaquinone biosynthesis C-methylase UbiE